MVFRILNRAAFAIAALATLTSTGALVRANLTFHPDASFYDFQNAG